MCAISSPLKNKKLVYKHKGYRKDRKLIYEFKCLGKFKVIIVYQPLQSNSFQFGKQIHFFKLVSRYKGILIINILQLDHYNTGLTIPKN